MSTNITFITPSNLGYFKSKLYDIFADKNLVDTLIGDDTSKSVRTIVAEELAEKLIPENAAAARDTLAEIAAWIQQHPEDASAMNAAITALQTAVNGLGSLASKSSVAESDLDTALKEKVNAAAEGNHSHGNKTVLDGITADKVSAWDGKSDFSGSYNDLTDKPTIPTTVAALSDSSNYAKKDELPTFTEATTAQIDALFA